jgi:hypothetical protein
VAVGVAARGDDRAEPLLGDAEELVRCAAARTASMAICTPPSVPFLKPTGIERPDASSRCTWLSVVRAPIAPHDTRSEVNCGEIGRGTRTRRQPSSFEVEQEPRARRRPSLMRSSVEVGIVDQPFQPTVVRGFSK